MAYQFSFDRRNTHETDFRTFEQGRGTFGCLRRHPGEQWLYFTVQQAGRVQFRMKSRRDHDYAVWGPFNSLDEARGKCGTGSRRQRGSLQRPIDCSYSASVRNSNLPHTHAFVFAQPHPYATFPYDVGCAHWVLIIYGLTTCRAEKQ